MNEFIEVRFTRKGAPLAVKRQVPGGIEFDEPDPIERSVGIGFASRTEATRLRMASIGRSQGWEPGQFKLTVSVEDGAIRLRGVNRHALPEGLYRMRLQVEEARMIGGPVVADLPHDGHTAVEVRLAMDERRLEADLGACDAAIRAVLDASMTDGQPGSDWLENRTRRPTRQACLLNLLASLRVRPSRAAPLISQVLETFFVGNDRVYAKVDRQLHDRLMSLVLDPSKPFYAEGKPKAAIHGRLLSSLPEPPDVRARFTDLMSFRGEARPALQVVVAVRPADVAYTYE